MACARVNTRIVQIAESTPSESIFFFCRANANNRTLVPKPSICIHTTTTQRILAEEKKITCTSLYSGVRHIFILDGRKCVRVDVRNLINIQKKYET